MVIYSSPRFVVAKSLQPGAHTCNPSYPGGRDQENRDLKSAQINSLRLYLKIPNKKRTGRMAQVVEHLPCKDEALNSKLNTHQKKKKSAYSCALVAHTCNPSYLGGWDWKDLKSRQIVWETPSSKANSWRDSISKVTRVKWTESVILEHLLFKTQNWNPSSTKRKKKSAYNKGLSLTLTVI
jgi:hypothetical protein